jgi:hypothetical protein
MRVDHESRLLGLVQESIGALDRPGRTRPKPHASGPRVERTEVDVVAILVGLAASEDRTFDRNPFVIDAAEDHAVGDMRRIEDVMRQRRRRILDRGCAVHERDGTERRFADGAGDDRERGLVGERNAPRGSQLHQQIVRMLMVRDLPAPIGFPLLQNFRVAGEADRERLGCRHSRQRERAGSKRTARHAHQPVLRSNLGVAAWSALTIEGGEELTIEADRPWRRRRVARSR